MRTLSSAVVLSLMCSAAMAVQAQDVQYVDVKQRCFQCHEEGPNSEWVKRGATVDWRDHDLHALAGRALSNELGKKILSHLPADSIQSCYPCHATPAAKQVLGHVTEWNATLGVSCEVCHGAASVWDPQHTALDWRTFDTEKKEGYAGFIDMRDPVRRAETCTSCHVGSATQGKLVTHEMYVAGHPPLAGFEMQGYLAAMPHHWTDIEDKPAAIKEEQIAHKLWNPDELHETKAAFAGTAVSLRTALDALAKQAHDAAHEEIEPRWPELGTMDCYACHHDLRQESWRRDIARVQGQGHDVHGAPVPGRPGLPTWHRAPLVDPQIVAAWQKLGGAAGGAEVAKAAVDLQTALTALDAEYREHPFGQPGEVKELAARARDKANDLVDALAKAKLSPADGQTLLDGLLAVGAASTLPFDDARQVAWIAHTLGLTELDEWLALTAPGAQRRSLPGEGVPYEWDTLEPETLLMRSLKPRAEFESNREKGARALESAWGSRK